MDLLSDYMKFPEDERVLNALIEFHKNKAEMLGGTLSVTPYPHFAVELTVKEGENYD